MENFTIVLQEPRSYQFYWLLIGAACLLLALFLLFCLLKILLPLFQTLKKKDKKELKFLSEKELSQLKKKYLESVEKLNSASNPDSKSDKKKVSQELSRLTRNFVYEATGIKVHTYTLTEIEALRMPKLTALIRQCYLTEFSDSDQINLPKAISNTKELIHDLYLEQGGNNNGI